MIRVVNEATERNYIVSLSDDSGKMLYFLVSSNNRMYTWDFANDVEKQFKAKGYSLPRGFMNWIGTNPNRSFRSDSTRRDYEKMRENSTPVYVERDTPKYRNDEMIEDENIIDLR